VISTAACVRKALSSPALHSTRQSRTDWRKISTKSCLLAYGAFSIMPRCVRSCGARLLTTLCTYSTSHRHDRLVMLLHMKLHMEICLMSASFACLTEQYLRRTRIPRSSKTRLCALPTLDILVMANIVYYFRDPSTRFSSRPPSSSIKKFLTILLMPPRR
jgi:hypothetical protein